MTLKQKSLLLILPFCIVFFSHCASKNDQNQNLILRGTFSDEVVTLDPYFLARQKQAEQSFFGFSPAQPSLKEADVDPDADDDELQLPETKHSLNATKENAQASKYGGLELYWPTTGTLTSVFGVRTLKHKTRMHTGIDIGAAKGTPILAAADGQILFAGVKKGYGFAVIIGHDNLHETLYGHMSKISVHLGQFVTRNSLIGYVGKTGRVTGANLHFETRINGIAYNPLNFLPPTHLGALRLGMKTPNIAEQIDYYNSDKRVAVQGN